MRAGNFFGDRRERLINPAIILKLFLTKDGDIIFFTIPLTDELVITFKSVFINGLLCRFFNQAPQLILYAYRQAAMGPLLQKVCDFADSKFITLWAAPFPKNIDPQRPQLLGIEGF